MLSLNRRQQVNLLHLVLAAPLLLYVGLSGIMKMKLNVNVYYLLAALGVTVSLYHGYLLVTSTSVTVDRANNNVVSNNVSVNDSPVNNVVPANNATVSVNNANVSEQYTTPNNEEIINHFILFMSGIQLLKSKRM